MGTTFFLSLLVTTAVGLLITVTGQQWVTSRAVVHVWVCLSVQARHSRRAEQLSRAVAADIAKCRGQQCAQPVVPCLFLVIAAVSSVSQHCWHLWACQPPQQPVGGTT